MEVNDFMLKLTNDLKEKRSVSDTTARLYIKNLWTVNGRKPFKSLTFLRKYDDVHQAMDGYAPASQKTFVASIVSALDGYKDKPMYKKAYNHWVDVMNGKVKEHNEAVASLDGGKTQKEHDNWVEWDDVQKKFEALKAEVAGFGKDITPKQFQTLQDYFVLGLYTQQPPRRNADYLNMWVYKGNAKDLDNSRNYLILSSSGNPEKFIFNVYKTARRYGQQSEEVKPELADTIKHYLKYHPLQKGNRKRTLTYKMLVKHDGSLLESANSITRILNRLFGKKVGSSLLRHSYLSGKYNLEEMEEDARMMAHSVTQQREYLRT